MKTEIKWGLIFALVLFLWICLEYAVGLHDKYIASHQYVSFIFVIPAAAMMYLALREKRRTLGGKISFTQAFLCGLGVSVVVSLLSPLTQYIFHRYVNPNFFNDFINYAVNSGKATLEQAQAYFNLKSSMIQGSVGALVMGVIISLILAAIMRSKRTL